MKSIISCHTATKKGNFNKGDRCNKLWDTS